MKINSAFTIVKSLTILIKYWTTISTSKTPKSLYNILQYFRLKTPSFAWICLKKTHLTFLERIVHESTKNRWGPFSRSYTPPSFSVRHTASTKSPELPGTGSFRTGLFDPGCGEGHLTKGANTKGYERIIIYISCKWCRKLFSVIFIIFSSISLL
jgi:hypothetical protein